MPRAYISATFKDLQQHRQIAHVVLKRFGYDDVAMEYYVAEDERPLDKCLRDVAECDVYVGIFAWRYGFVPETDNPKKLSITELEYRKAVELKKPRLLFVIDEDADWPAKFMDIDRTSAARLHEAVRKDRLSGTFSTPDTLEARLSAALEKRGDGQVVASGIDITAYAKFLRRRYNILDLDALTDPTRDEFLQLRLQAVFVEQNAKEDSPPLELPKEAWELLLSRKAIDPEDLPEGLTAEMIEKLQTSYVSKPSRGVLEILSATDNRCTIILGDPGSGKSTLLRYVTLSLLDDARGAALQPALAGRLPFLIDLKSYTALRRDKTCDTFFDYFDVLAKQEGCPVTSKTLATYFKAKSPAVVLFDGIDEIFDPAEQEAVTRQIAAFADSHPEARIIVTSRIIGYRRTILTQAGFRHFTLQDFDEKQVINFVRQWYTLTLGNRADEADARVERIRRSFRDSASIRQLSGNPMLLTIMAIIGKHQELPRERWKLYAHATGVLVQHWDVKRHLQNKQLGDLMDEEDKKELLRRLAYAMQRGKGGLAGNYIHAVELQAEFEAYLRERYQLPVDRAVVIAREMIAQFRERNFILSFYGAGVYGFVHRAFLEYFCAEAIKTKFEKTTELPLEKLKTEIFGKHWNEKVWHEVLRLICGMIGEQFAGDLIEYLRSLGYRETGGVNIALALQCLLEIRRIEQVEAPAANLLKTLFAWIDDGYRANLYVDALNTSLNTAKLIGARWPGRESIVEWLLRMKDTDRHGPNSYFVGELLGRLTGGFPAAYEHLIQYIPDGSFRAMNVIAPYALAAGWPDEEEVLPFLKNVAEHSRSPTAPIYAAAKFLSHRPEAVDWVFDLVNSAASHDAIAAISTWLREDPRVVPVMKTAATQGSNTAAGVLASRLDDTSVRDLLVDLSENHPDQSFRKDVRRLLEQRGVEPKPRRTKPASKPSARTRKG